MSTNGETARHEVLERMAADVTIFMGTSLSMGITAAAASIARDENIGIFSFNPGQEEGALLGLSIHNIAAPTEPDLPELCRRLGIPTDCPNCSRIRLIHLT